MAWSTRPGLCGTGPDATDLAGAVFDQIFEVTGLAGSDRGIHRRIEGEGRDDRRDVRSS